MYLIVSLYLDGEIKSIEGYVDDEKTAKKKVKELNYSVLDGESYQYFYEFIEKLN